MNRTAEILKTRIRKIDDQLLQKRPVELLIRNYVCAWVCFCVPKGTCVLEGRQEGVEPRETEMNREIKSHHPLKEMTFKYPIEWSIDR